ncbi:hypothetical protein DFH28DRAFT_905872 [Melampsora americana]|nr:hypothetical protein DFH28DRAFT_905872 [Melampsora americana]
MRLSQFTQRLAKDYPELYLHLELHDLVRFAVLAAELTARAQGTWVSRNEGEVVVPWLRTVLNISLPIPLCYDLWQAILPTINDFHVQPGILIQQHGHHPEHLSAPISESTLVAPVQHCLLCPNAPKLHHRGRLEGYLYDVDGVHTVAIVTMKCPKCPTYYRPSYYSTDGFRTYYSAHHGRHRDAFQVSCHFFMTHRLAHFLRQGMMLAHISNFNLVNLFNSSHVDGVSLPVLHAAPTVQPSLSEITCRDALDLHVLLAKADSAYSSVVVNTTIAPDKRYEQAMEKVLEWIALEGSKHRNHACSACVRVVHLAGEDQQANLGYIRAVVTDGITIGHWRCTATAEQLRELARTQGQPPPNGPCTSSLARVKDRFCPFHQEQLGKRCQAQPCGNDAIGDSPTCALKEHIEAHSKFKARVTGNFALTSMLHRPGSNLPSDPTVHQHWNTAELVNVEEVQQGDEGDRAHEQTRDGGDGKRSNRVCLSRSRTHNDQLIVGTCGIILARETFFHSESVSAVRDFILRTFPHQMPQVCFYDNACKLVEHIYHGGEEYTAFLNTVFPVDPFHFRGHKASDDFCQHDTDPKLFPELQESGNWIFNSSAAEMTNVWYGGFASVARSMSAIRFNFMMEDMIERRNDWLIRRLAKRSNISFLGDLTL